MLPRTQTPGADRGASDVIDTVDAMEEVCDLVAELADRVRSHFDQAMAAAGLPAAQGRALRHLEEPLHMRALAGELKVDASYITTIVDRLEGQGLVDRMVDPADRRVKNLVLTPEGRRRNAALRADLFSDVPGISALSARQRAVLRDLLLEMLGHS